MYLVNNDYLAHHGILGMHWGIRRFQPYSVHPRKGGEGGKEVGEAKKSVKNKADIKKYGRRGEKKISELESYGITRDQARRIYRDRRFYGNKRMKKIAKKVANGERMQVAKGRAITNRALMGVVKASAALGASVILNNWISNHPRQAAKAIYRTTKAIGKIGKATYKGASKVAKAGANAYWHINPKNAPKVDVWDVNWKDLGPADLHVPAVVRRR